MAKKIGVLGSGVVGRTLADGFLKNGYEVMLGTRDSARGEVPAWVAKHEAAHSGAKAGTFRETAAFGEIVVLAVKGLAAEEVLNQAGPDHLTGKIVIDTTNPLASEKPVNGILTFSTGPNESLGEKVQALLPNTHVVKAFNSVGSALMIDPKFDGGPGGRDYYDENNGWTYMWQVQEDIPGLILLMGGPKAFEERLDQLFREDLGRAKNEFWK